MNDKIKLILTALILTPLIFIGFVALMIWIFPEQSPSQPTSLLLPSSSKSESQTFQPPAFQKIRGFPGELECSNSFYTKESITAEIFPKFLNYLAKQYCLKICKVCLINVYNNPIPYEVCMSPMTDNQECDSLHIGHWDNFKNPVRWFKDSSGKKYNF
jgi:hypothetical protein